MIPQRTLGAELFGNGLKSRVNACRKRVRNHRVTRKLQVDCGNEVENEPQNGSEFPVNSTVVRQSLDGITNFEFPISGVAVSQTPSGDASISDLRLEISEREQEVGIT